MCGIWGFLSTQSVEMTDEMTAGFASVGERGRDDTQVVRVANSFLGFHRLAIVGQGVQPFHYQDDKYHYYMVCNGEIYNYRDLYELFLSGTEYEKEDANDCEVLFRLLIQQGRSFNWSVVRGVFAGVFSRIGKNSESHLLFRDHYGVRPLYYGTSMSQSHELRLSQVHFSSTLFGLNYLESSVYQFPPGVIMTVTGRRGDYTYSYQRIASRATPEYNHNYTSSLSSKIVRESLIRAVRVQSHADRPICCLLSGGVDSSLVASILAYYSPTPIHTFTISTEAGGLDVDYAAKVAAHIGSVHTHVKVSTQEALAVIPEVVRVTGTYDTTTIRAATWQYLIAKYISEKTDFKVLFCGDGSDEVHGSYLYLKYAPSLKEFDAECKRLVGDIHFFDVRRADGATSCHSLELRVPFLDQEYVNNYFKLHLTVRNRPVEKALLREAFSGTVPDGSRTWLPSEVLHRRKEAFSDSTSTAEEPWRVTIQRHVQTLDLPEKPYTHLPPLTDEMGWYRALFEGHFGDRRETVLPYYWMPRWVSVPDGEPSATAYAS